MRASMTSIVGFVKALPAGVLERLTIAERVAIIFTFLAIGGAVTTVIAIVWLGPPLTDFLGANLPLVRFLVAATAVLVMTIPTAFLIIYLELKVIARMNLRVGPNRVGPWCAAMSVVHGL